MRKIAAALADDARWGILELLAERPRSVGEIVELTGLRQPQATKHLQTLAQAGLATVYPLGQRRVYAVEARSIEQFQQALGGLLESSKAHQRERDIIERYWAAIQTGATQADKDRWADGRTFLFQRTIAQSPETVWEHWTSPKLLAAWWAPPSLRAVVCRIEPEPQGDVALEYAGSGERHRSVGAVSLADAPNRLVFDLSVLGRNDKPTFTAHYDLSLVVSGPGACLLKLDMTITETTVEALPFIAGIETGWNQVLDQLETMLGAID